VLTANATNASRPKPAHCSKLSVMSVADNAAGQLRLYGRFWDQSKARLVKKLK